MNKQSQTSETNETNDSGALDLMMPLDFSSVMEMNQDAIDSVGEMNQKMYEGLSSYNAEMFKFVNSRLKEDFAIPQHLMTCRTPQEVYNVYTEFFQTAMKQYLSEAERLTSLGGGVAGAALQTMEHQVEGACKAADVAIKEAGNAGNKKAKAAKAS